jgi:polysaccharide biosynthesis/export protein
MFQKMCLPFLTLSIAIGTLCAQTTGLLPSPAGNTSEAGLALNNVTSGPLGPGDLIFVSVPNCPEVTRSYRVSTDGLVQLPLLRHPVAAAGVTPVDLEKTIRDAIKEDRILVDPSVTISVLEYRSRPVSVNGSVKHSLTFQAVGDMTLLDAIARADGFAPESGAEVLVYHAVGAGEGPDAVKHILIRDLLAGSDPSLNIALHGGEEIRVPEAPKLFIVGNVKNPGAYPIKDPKALTVLEALALCQGTLAFTQKIAYIYRSAPGDSARQEIPVALDKIVRRKAPDTSLEPNDIFYVPDNPGKRLTATVLDRISGFGSSTASGLIIFK